MGALIRATDWASTPLGRPETWPQSLRTALSICLQSRYPIFIWWGPQMVNLYNDAYRPILGDKHPRSLGRPAFESCSEIGPIIGPMIKPSDKAPPIMAMPLARFSGVVTSVM